MMSAIVAGVGSAPSGVMMFANRARAVLGITLRHSARIAHVHDALKAGIVIRKFLMEVLNGVAKFFWYALAGLHDEKSMPFVLLVVKG